LGLPLRPEVENCPKIGLGLVGAMEPEQGTSQSLSKLPRSEARLVHLGVNAQGTMQGLDGEGRV
jgi:hypothetical protein